MQVVGLVVQVVPAFWRVHLGMCAGSLMLRTCLNAGACPLVVCSLLCPSYCFVFVALLANMPLFRILRAFLEGFMGFMWVCVACVLCVACGAFVCVSG